MRTITLLSLSLTLLLLLTAGCSRRMAPFAPHRTPTVEHLAATTSQQCLECHEVSQRPQHQPSDNCLRCHRILPGG